MLNALTYRAVSSAWLERLPYKQEVAGSSPALPTNLHDFQRHPTNDAMKDLSNRVALVTGGSRGIGAAVALALANAGADVAVNYRERADAAHAVCTEITGMGRKAIAIQADVSVSAEVKRMITEVEPHLGGIDILVNNAAIAHP